MRHALEICALEFRAWFLGKILLVDFGGRIASEGVFKIKPMLLFDT